MASGCADAPPVHVLFRMAWGAYAWSACGGPVTEAARRECRLPGPAKGFLQPSDDGWSRALNVSCEQRL